MHLNMHAFRDPQVQIYCINNIRSYVHGYNKDISQYISHNNVHTHARYT